MENNELIPTSKINHINELTTAGTTIINIVTTLIDLSQIPYLFVSIYIF